MNSVELIGRLTADPEIRYTSADNKAVATFTLAVYRDGQKDANGKKIADFPRVTVFGRTAETIEKYVKKGRMIGVNGRIQTGSYQNKNGDTVYTTDVVAFRVDLLPSGEKRAETPKQKPEPQQTDAFEEIDEDVPF